MSGYIIELYRYICTGKSYIYENNLGDKIESDNVQEDSYMTFGYFDKMAISRVTAFSRMRNMSELSKKWIGERQTLLLYEIDQNNDLVYRNDEEYSGFYVCIADRMQRSENLFIAVSMLQFIKSPDEEDQDMEECMRAYRKNILELVEANAKVPVYCSVMGTLDTYGVAILWASDQYVEILRLIDQIKGTNVRKSAKNKGNNFLSIFTIFAKNNIEDELLARKMKLVDGKATLQITLQTELNQNILNIFQEKFRPEEFLHSSGEYDLLIKADIRNLYKLFEKDEILHPRNSFYNKYILQTNVRFCEEKKFVDTGLEETKKKEMDEPNDPDEIWNTLIRPAWKKYGNVRKKFLEKFPKTAGMVDSLDLLYGDFVSKVSSVSNKMWARDFLYQFNAILDVIIKYLDNISNDHIQISPIDALSDFRDILNCYEHQIIHIAESSNLVIDTPKCHLRYTGQNNLTLYAYFGFTKDIIELCYRIQGNSKQSIILPLISADIVPIIESTMYIDDGTPNDDRVIKLNIPVTALYNIPEYLPYLYHEIFHYVVPEDRAARNWIKGIFLNTIGVRNVVRHILCLYMKNCDEIRKEIEYLTTIVLNPYVYRSVYQRYYDSVVASVRGVGNKQRKMKVAESDVKNWRQYEQETFSRLLTEAMGDEFGMVQQNLIIGVMEDLYLQREVIKAEAMALESGIDTDIAAKCIDELMNVLEGIGNNTDNNAKVKALHRHLDIGNCPMKAILGMDELETLSDGLSEVACDIPMVELGNMSIVHYMLSYVKIQKDLLRKSKGRMSIQDALRIGITFDFLEGFSESVRMANSKMDSYEREFIAAYVGLYYSTKKEKEEVKPGECLVKVKAEAEGWFSWIKGGYQEYLKDYSLFSPIFKKLISQISVEQRSNHRNLDELKNIAESKKLLNKLRNMELYKYYDALKLYGEKILAIIQKKPDISEKEFAKAICYNKESFHQKIFDMNIKYIQSYQKQSNFEEIREIRDAYAPKNKDYPIPNNLFEGVLPEMKHQPKWGWINAQRNVEDYVYKVNGTLELFSIIEKISQNFSRQSIECYGNDKHEIWYRGQSKSSYTLLPSAMRKYLAVKNNINTLLDYQIDAYGEFKFRMDNSSEKVERAGYTVCDYLALMQHYGAPTIYMDWSENALWSLYFALEEHIDFRKKQERHTEDAVLFMLHPNLYNEARNQMMELAKEYPCTLVNKNLSKTKQKSTDFLPNLSLENNREKYYMFLLGANEDNLEANKSEFLKHKYNGLRDSAAKELLLYLPLAIYASRANARVRAQHGMFMAFNVLTPLSTHDNFEYIALEEIQKLYLETFKDRSPFLYKIVISKDCKEEIARWLKTVGICKDMIYPELSNIGERI